MSSHWARSFTLRTEKHACQRGAVSSASLEKRVLEGAGQLVHLLSSAVWMERHATGLGVCQVTERQESQDPKFKGSVSDFQIAGSWAWR